jgi:DNA primase
MTVNFAAVREHHPLATVARRTGYVLPEPRGDVFVACPMAGHEDSTPSMLLHLDEDRYHCFGCGASGDVLQWVRDVYGVDARSALAMLDASNDRFPDPPSGAVATMRSEVRQQHRSDQPDLTRTPAGRVKDALAAAWAYYTLPRLAEKAAAYLADRGIDVSGLGDVAGYTPYNPDQLVTHLRKRGFSDDELVDAGLARRREREMFADAFQQRVLFAVRDQDGDVVGLIGRSTRADDRRIAAKYLNPPRTAVYDKSTALYTPVDGDLAQDGQVVIVEGAIDVLAIDAAARCAGLGDRFLPVCTSGVAFSDRQIEQILAIHRRAPVIALDGDAAGRRAAARLAARIAQHGREAAIVTWPDGEDPASWLERHGSEGLAAVTRRGCLEVDGAELRPRHAAPEAAGVLLEEADGKLDAKVAAALGPAARMTPQAAERYASEAAAAIAPVVVAAGASISTDNRGRVNHVIETVATYGTKFPTAAQQRFVELAVREIETRELAPGAWAERQISARLDHDQAAPEVSASGAVIAPVQAAGASG